MTTPTDLFRWYETHLRMPYAADSHRLDPSAPTTDCSGAVVRDLRSCGIDPGPNVVSTSLEVWARTAGGRAISVAQGIATPGAGLFHWGLGANGHVAMSRGNGTTFETPAWGAYGHALGIGNAYGRDWTGAALWPKVDYSGHVPAPAPYPPLARILRSPESGQDVLEAQLRLTMWAHVWNDNSVSPGPCDGIFGRLTTTAVRNFQARSRIGIDGVIGPQTWAALWHR
jgi:peptidoglycan hydrolase-like protein with peptidoglycan-binding domain